MQSTTQTFPPLAADHFSNHLHPRFPELLLPPSFLADDETVGGGPILPQPGFVTLEADPPNVILLPAVFVGESLALLIP